MKLIRFGAPGQEKPGVILPGNRKVDVSEVVDDYNERFFASNDTVNEINDWLKTNTHDLPIIKDSVRLGAPLQRPSKIVCIGLNYANHAKESGMSIPEEPIIFFKATSAICGPYDDLVLPRGGDKTDWEVELAVIIGKEAKYVREETAMDHVFGYCLHNDYSERAFQLEQGGQWVKGKSCDTFAPLGPFIATREEIPDPHQLPLWLKLNNETLQDSNTSDLIFSIPYLVSYLSQFMTLLPGDIISTGTPEGVGLGFDPPRYLKAGDVVELGIEGLGTAKQKVVKAV
ncbi:MAG: fumarylacetoacetate hydrolase family protein [Cytophagales bacterium]|nr:fumarylacetoacetate hydrolase family protein [Cytophagales bacterium]